MDLIAPLLSVPVTHAALAAGGGYLLGSVIFGLITARLAGLGDIRSIGSGNIGATNVLRTGNKGIALLTLIGDAGKGALAVWLASQFLSPEAGILAGMAAFIGHLFPIWIGFKGGKGVATYLGIVAALSSTLGLIACLVWIHMLLIFRYSSLGSLTTALATPPLALYVGAPGLLLPLGVMSLLIFWRHRENIVRLLNRTEPRVFQKKSEQESS
ncbi:MAG: glycerol-3-phosphate 1-O-acyltransferase PlsY [Pseudomonadota bacterium]